VKTISIDKFQKRRLINTYISVVISISFVLFLVGFLAILFVNFNKVTDHFKEQIALTVFFNENAKSIEIKQLQKSFLLQKETKNIVYTSKEEAAKEHSLEIGEDFMELLGYNPLHNSINVYFNSTYVTPIFLKNISEDFQRKSYVSEVLYDEPLIQLLDENINKISKWMIILSLIFIVAAIVLINSSISLSIYSKRLIIKTMQLVGATKSFIRKPFIMRYILLGIYGSLIAILGIIVLLYTLNEKIPELNLLSNPIELFTMLIILFFLCIIITAISSFFAIQKFLNLNTEVV